MIFHANTPIAPAAQTASSTVTSVPDACRTSIRSPPGSARWTLLTWAKKYRYPGSSHKTAHTRAEICRRSSGMTASSST